MSDIDQVLKNLSYRENMYLKDLKEDMYRQGRRNTPFNFSDYPKLRKHIIDRDTRLYDLPPVLEDRYTTYDDEGAVRDMASSVLAKRYRQNRRNRNIRTLKARDRLDLARIIEAGLPEEIGRKIARERNKIDVYEGGGRSESPNSKAKSMRHNRLMRLDPEYRKTHNAATRLQSMYRGKSARKRLSKRKSSKKEPRYDDYNPLKSNAPEYIKQTIDLPLDIQEMIANKVNETDIRKLQRLTRQNNELIENYKNKVRGNLPLSNYGSLLNTQLGNTDKVLRYDEFSNTTMMIVFDLPSDIANLLIGTIQYLEDDIDELYSMPTLQKLLQFLAQDDNLNNFISIFELTLKQSFQYTPLEIQQYINNFLTAINFRL